MVTNHHHKSAGFQFEHRVMSFRENSRNIARSFPSSREKNGFFSSTEWKSPSDVPIAEKYPTRHLYIGLSYTCRANRKTIWMHSGMYFRIGINIGFYMYITQKNPLIVRGPPILLSLFCRFVGFFLCCRFL